MAFQQAGIEVQRVSEFEKLSAAITQAFSNDGVEKFLKALTSKSIRVRDFATVLDRGILGKNARALYDALVVTDQAQIRELYLQKLEQVDPALRFKFHRTYASY